MIVGDDGVESVYDFYSAGISPTGSNTPGRTPVTGMRGATGAGDGVHILTGPIAVQGAMPGDVIAVTINDLRPRVNPNTGKTYGINAAAWWGYNFGVNGPKPGGMFGKGSAATMAYDTATPAAAFVQSGFTGGAYQREMTTVYEIINDATGKPAYAQPAFQFQYGLNNSVTTPCLVNGTGSPVASVTMNPGVSVACAAGVMSWKGYQFPGMITDHSKTTLDYSVAGLFQVPINFHGASARGAGGGLSGLTRRARSGQHGPGAGCARVRRLRAPDADGRQHRRPPPGHRRHAVLARPGCWRFAQHGRRAHGTGRF